MFDDPILTERYAILETLDGLDRDNLARARDRVSEREVFLQFPVGVQEPERALREARALAGVDHPGVIRLLHVLESAAGPVLVLEPFPARTLADELAHDGPLDADRVRTLGAAIARAVHALHAAGLVHRNLDERSIFLAPNGSPSVGGFRLAKPRNLQGLSSIDYTARSATEPQTLPPHPAPELWLGHAADARSDVYSLGAILLHAATGRVLLPDAVFDADDTTWSGNRDRELGRIVTRCLARSPSARFETAAALADALEGNAERTAASGRRTPARRLAVPAAALLAGVLATIGVWSAFAEHRGVDPTPPARPPTPSAYSSEYDASHAIVIGIDYRGPASEQHGWPRLARAEGDAEEVARRLESLGWNVHRLFGADADQQGIEDALREQSLARGPNDQLLVYYAGHGVLHPHAETSGYLAPSDAGPRIGTTGLSANCISFDDFERLSRECRAKHVLVALDCCHGGAATFRGDPTRRPRASSPRVAGLDRRAHVLLSSARADELARDDSDFARTFARALDRVAKGTPCSVTRLAADVKETGYGQNAVLDRFGEHADNDGEFWFLPN